MRTIASVILALILFSCDDDKEPARIEGFIEAQKNQVHWEGLASAIQSEYAGDTLYISGQGVEEVLTMKIIFTGPGHYPLQKHQGFYYTTLGSDVVISQYKTDDGNYVGSVRITDYDEERKVIEGNFELALKRIRPDNGDAVTFAMGRFKAQISAY